MKKHLFDFISSIEDERKDRIIQIYKDHEHLFHTNPGSTYIHQCWPGGLADHLRDMYELCELEYKLLSNFLKQRGEQLPFTLGSAQTVIFAHDAEKVIVYGDKTDKMCKKYFDEIVDMKEKTFKENLKWKILNDWKDTYGFVLTECEINAVKYTHGEGDDYRNDRRVMNELAAFVGNIDRTSARILYNSGKDLA